MSPFEAYGVWGDGVPRPLLTHPNLEAVLSYRDDLRKRSGRLPPPYYGVFDTDDPELGDAEWEDLEQ